jgi:PKD repeat protein
VILTAVAPGEADPPPRTAWKLGDGTTATADAASVLHVYTKAGTYTAEVTATVGGEEQRATATITLAPAPTATRKLGPAGGTVTRGACSVTAGKDACP